MGDAGTLAILSIPAGLFVFSIIIFVHEMGHFLTARAFGVKVDAFSIGFGPTLTSWRDKHGTEWRVAAFPLGGYVKFFGDASAASNPDLERLKEMRAEMDRTHGAGTADACFHFKPVWQRALVVGAGPAANFILSIAIFAALTLSFGGPPRSDAVIDAVVAESPAARGGLEPADRIVTANGRAIDSFETLQRYVQLRGGETVLFEVERGGETLTLDVELGRTERPGFLDRPVVVGFLGVSASRAPEDMVRERVGPLGALSFGAAQTWMIGETTVQHLGRIVTGREDADQLGGLLRIGGVSGDIAKKSIEQAQDSGQGPWAGVGAAVLRLIELAAILSVGIGLLNLLPIPVLDGGHLVYYAYEAVVGRPMGEAAQEWGFRIGLALVLGLMLFVFVNDLRFFAGL